MRPDNAEVIVFKPRRELDAESNLRGFVDSCRNHLTALGGRLAFDDDAWDVTDHLDVRGRGNQRHRIIFSDFATTGERAPTIMREPFLSFSKAYLRYMQGLRPVKNLHTRLTALRALEAAVREMAAPTPVAANSAAFNRAAQLVEARYSPVAAHRMGGQLQILAEFLVEHALTTTPFRWRSFLKRPSDTVRVGEQFDKRRREKLPSVAALEALPRVFRLAAEPQDVIPSAVAVILCAAPDRISEVLSLPKNCEVTHRGPIGEPDAYGLRWWPAKGADPMVKWVIPSMTDVVREAISRIRKVTEPARALAKWFEQRPGQLYLPAELEHLRSSEDLALEDLATIVGLTGKGAARAWCKRLGVPIFGPDGAQHTRFRDVEKAVCTMLPRGFPVLNPETGLDYSDALLVVRRNELHPRRGTYQCVFEPVTITQINTALGNRTAHGFGSIFSRFGFIEPDGTPIKVTSHQYRHYLNTLAQAGGMSQLDIAKWSGRKDVRQNATYDHVTPDQMLAKVREAIGDGSQMFGPLAELPTRLPISRDEFGRLRAPTAHTTDLGYCIHDYTMSPCQLHRDCLNCEDLVCVTGDAKKTARIRERLAEARELLVRAEEARADGYAGSDRWLTHHAATVERLAHLCAIMDDPTVPDGAIIQLAPPPREAQIGNTDARAVRVVEFAPGDAATTDLLSRSARS